MIPVKYADRPVVVSLLNQKGGSGKTTIATNLAHGLVKRGFKTLLVDADPQGSARDWNNANEATLVPVIGLDRETLPVDLKAVWAGYKVVVIDGAPQVARLLAAAVKASDIILIPVQPSPYDIWATADLVSLIKARQEVMDGHPKAAFVISRVIKNTKLSREVEAALEEYELPVFKAHTSQLVSYAVTASEGLSVYSNPSSPGAQEIDAIINELFERILC